MGWKVPSSKLWAAKAEADGEELQKDKINWQVNFSLNKSEAMNRVGKESELEAVSDELRAAFYLLGTGCRFRYIYENAAQGSAVVEYKTTIFLRQMDCVSAG